MISFIADEDEDTIRGIVAGGHKVVRVTCAYQLRARACFCSAAVANACLES